MTGRSYKIDFGYENPRLGVSKSLHFDIKSVFSINTHLSNFHVSYIGVRFSSHVNIICLRINKVSPPAGRMTRMTVLVSRLFSVCHISNILNQL